MISPTLQQKQAMERPSAWARDEDLEEGRRLHDLRAVRTQDTRAGERIATPHLPSAHVCTCYHEAWRGSTSVRRLIFITHTICLVQKAGWAATLGLSYKCVSAAHGTMSCGINGRLHA